MEFAGKAADLCILSLVWLLTSLPIITIGASCTALYYAVTKSVRKDCGHAVREYFSSFRQNFKQGAWITLILLPLLALVVYSMIVNNLRTTESTLGTALILMQCIILIMGVFVGVYVFAILSRFSFSVLQCIQTSFTMAARHIFTTFLLAAILLVSCELIYRLPFLIVILPGVATWISSLLLERVFRKYMTKPDTEESTQWYWQ
jgi:uncharacterized membrane protein YesL